MTFFYRVFQLQALWKLASRDESSVTFFDFLWFKYVVFSTLFEWPRETTITYKVGKQCSVRLTSQQLQKIIHAWDLSFDILVFLRETLLHANSIQTLFVYVQTYIKRPTIWLKKVKQYFDAIFPCFFVTKVHSFKQRPYWLLKVSCVCMYTLLEIKYTHKIKPIL